MSTPEHGAFAVDTTGGEYVPVDAPVLDALPPAADTAALVPVDQAPVATPTTPPQAPHNPPTDEPGDETPQGLPAGHLAAGGASAAGIAGTALYQVGGVLGLAAGGAVAGVAGAAYLKHRWDARRNAAGGRQQTRTIKTTQSRTTGASGGILGGRSTTGRGSAGRGAASRMPGLGGRSTSGSGRQGGRLLGGSGRGASGGAGRGASARTASSPARGTAKGRSAGKVWASDGGGAGLRVPGRKKAADTQTTAKTSAKGGGQAAAKETTTKKTAAGQSAATTPTATKKKAAEQAAPTSRFSRWAADREAKRGGSPTRALRWARRLDEAAHGRTGAWGLLLRLIFGWRSAEQETEQEAAAEQAAQDQQPQTPETAAQAAPGPQQAERPQQAAPAARRGDRREPVTSYGRTHHMSGNPLVVGTAEVLAAAAAYEPEDMWDVNEALRSLPEMSVNTANALRMFIDRLDGVYPLDASVLELLRTYFDALAGTAAIGDEVYAHFRVVHEDDLKRDEAPRAGEEKWNVRR